MRAGVAAARDVYCYFDNTDKVKAPASALKLLDDLRLALPS